MEEIKIKIESEKNKLNSLNRQKEEILYIIPDRINNKLKQIAKGVLGIGAISIVFGGAFIGSIFAGDALLGLKTGLFIGLPASVACLIFKSISDTSKDRGRLKFLKKRYNLNQIEHEISLCQSKIKELERELFRVQHTIPKQNIESSNYTRRSQQVNYYYEDSYTNGRSR